MVLGFAGFLLGCSGQSTAPSLDPETKAATKKAMVERNAERKEAAAERAKMKKEARRGTMKGADPGKGADPEKAADPG